MSLPAIRPMALEEWRRKASAGEAAPDALLRKYLDPALVTVKAAADDSRRITFTISTAAVDREGDTIAVDGWQLDSYLANPVVLYAHDYRSLPVGKAVSVTKAGGKLKAVAEFVPADTPVVGPMAEAVFRLLKGGFLRATSVGFRPIKSAHNEDRGGFWPTDFLEQELLEFSVVPVPANPEALMDTAKGLAAAMAEGVDLTALEQAFALARSVSGRVAPTLVVPRAGRVFSAANEKILRDAHACATTTVAECTKAVAHLQSLIDQMPATPEDPDAGDDQDDDENDDVEDSARAATPPASEPAATPAPTAPPIHVVTAGDLKALVATAATAALDRHARREPSKE